MLVFDLFRVQGMVVNASYCGEAEENGPLVGNIRIESTPILEYNNVQLTAILATTVEEHTVAVLGSSSGHLKKVRKHLKMIECKSISLEKSGTKTFDLIFFIILSRAYIFMVHEQNLSFYNPKWYFFFKIQKYPLKCMRFIS